MENRIRSIVKHFVLVTLLLIFAVAACAQEEPIIITSHMQNEFPLFYRRGPHAFSGFVVEVANELSQRADFAFDISFGRTFHPIEKSMKALTKGEIDILFGVRRTRNYARKFNIIPIALYIVSDVVVTPTSNIENIPPKLCSIAEPIIATSKGMTFLTISCPSLKVSSVSTENEAFHKLSKGEANIFFTNDMIAKTYFGYGLVKGMSIVDIHKRKIKYYVATRKGIDHSIKRKIAVNLMKMYRSGLLQNIYKKYLNLL